MKFYLSRLHERTIDDLDIIYDELLHIKALSHLSSLVKRELASVLIFEAHPFKGEICKEQKTKILSEMKKRTYTHIHTYAYIYT